MTSIAERASLNVDTCETVDDIFTDCKVEKNWKLKLKNFNMDYGV